MSNAVRAKRAAPAVGKTEERQMRRFQQIADHYRLAIIEGRLKPGDRLPSERTISETFGVGRASVREALFTLSRLGFVAVNEGARARVTEPDPRTVFRELGGVAALMLRSPDGVRELQMLRLIVETGLARQAAAQASDTQIAEIEAALLANARACGNAAAFVQTDLAFHRTIAASVGNSLVLALLDGLAEWLIEQRSSRRQSQFQEVALEEHRRVFEAIAARDPVRAQDAMEAHLVEVARNYWQA